MTKKVSLSKRKLSKARILPPSYVSRTNLLLFALIFVAIGGYVLYRSFAAPNPNLQGDLNNDNSVNITDLSILLSDYGTSNAAADINGDSTVNITDLSILLSNYGRTTNPNPPPPPQIPPPPPPPPSGGGTRSGPFIINANWTATEDTYFASYKQDSATVVSTHAYTTAIERHPGVKSWLVTAPPHGKARLYGRLKGTSGITGGSGEQYFGYSFYLEGWNTGEIFDNGNTFCAFTGTRYDDGQPNGPRGLAGCFGRTHGDTSLATRTIIDPSTSVAGSELDEGKYITNGRWIDQVQRVKWSHSASGQVEIWTKYADQTWAQATHILYNGITDYWPDGTGGTHVTWLGIYQGDSFTTTHKQYWGPYRMVDSSKNSNPFAAVDPDNSAL
jgi:hypothetical protein